jgi:hypothetical protein
VLAGRFKHHTYRIRHGRIIECSYQSSAQVNSVQNSYERSVLGVSNSWDETKKRAHFLAQRKKRDRTVAVRPSATRRRRSTSSTRRDRSPRRRPSSMGHPIQQNPKIRLAVARSDMRLRSPQRRDADGLGSY